MASSSVTLFNLRIADHIAFSKGFEFELILYGLKIPPSVRIRNMGSLLLSQNVIIQAVMCIRDEKEI